MVWTGKISGSGRRRETVSQQIDTKGLKTWYVRCCWGMTVAIIPTNLYKQQGDSSPILSPSCKIDFIVGCIRQITKLPDACSDSHRNDILPGFGL